MSGLHLVFVGNRERASLSWDEEVKIRIQKIAISGLQYAVGGRSPTTQFTDSHTARYQHSQAAVTLLTPAICSIK